MAILWPSERDKYIKKLTDGNERIIAAEIQTKNKPICLINVYLPTKMANSDCQYQENLDILQTMIDKYVDSHTIIICGDMKGSLSIERNNSHDAKLKSLMKLNKFHLHTDVRNPPAHRCQKPINFLSSRRKVKISNRLHHFK